MSINCSPRVRNRIVAVLAAGMLGSGAMLALNTPAEAQRDKPPAVVEEAKSHANSLSLAFRHAAEKATPSVVKITTRAKAKPVGQEQPGENPFKGTPLEEFFKGREMGPMMERNGQRFSPPRSGLGSGVIIDADGIVLTNNHVVEGADEVIVHLADGRQFSTTEVKTDPQTDLAVLRIDTKNEKLPAAQMGDSLEMEIGDWVIAIGHPFELEQTVSAGIISGKGRTIGSVERATFLQTDAAINPGNSGGPLVDLQGRVIGINTAIASNSGGYQGIGFAIPINLAKNIARQLVDKGAVERAYLGVAISQLTPDLAQQLGVDRGAGVLVAEVYKDTPAAEAGFEAGDVIASFAGTKVNTPRDLQSNVEQAAIGSEQEVEVNRGGEIVKLQVKMRPLPSDRMFASAQIPATPEEKPENFNSQLGMAVTELTEAVASQLDMDVTQGVLITQVDQTGVAYANGIREGMVVMKVGRTPVTTPEEFQQALDSANLKEGVLLLVKTPQGNRFVVVKSQG